jgi:hypothetical protein
MLRPTVSRPIYLGIRHPFAAYDLIFIIVTHLRVLLMWGSLSDERTGLSFTISAGPRQRSPVGLATIFYCLRFETSSFVASYDSQGHGGGIRTRLHTGKLQSDLNSLIRVCSLSVSKGMFLDHSYPWKCVCQLTS